MIGTIGYPYAKQKRTTLNIYLNLTPHTKLNQKWIIDLNVRAEKTNVLERDIRENTCDLWYGKECLETKLTSFGEKNNTWNFITIKNF